MKYTKRQINEAISYWKKELRRLNEAGENGIETVDELLIAIASNVARTGDTHGNTKYDSRSASDISNTMLNANAHIGTTGHSYVGDVQSVEQDGDTVRLVFAKKNKITGKMPTNVMTLQQLVDELEKVPPESKVVTYWYQDDPLSKSLGLKDETAPIAGFDCGSKSGGWIRI